MFDNDEGTISTPPVPCVYALCRLRIHIEHNSEGAPRPKSVDGNLPPQAASLQPAPLLPEDLWWAPSPGCPPPTHRKEVHSDLGDSTPPTARGK